MIDNKTIILIGAISLNGVYGIGRGEQGKLAWRSKLDMDFFRDQTTGNTTAMGRGSWLSLPKKFRPLPDRQNVVVTSNPETCLSQEDRDKGVLTACSINQAIAMAAGEKVFVFGSFDMWNGTAPVADELYITVIGINVDTDTKQEVGHPGFVLFPQLLDPTTEWRQFEQLGDPLVETETPKTGDPFSVKFMTYVRKDRHKAD